jgi:hypothetical protein
MTSSENDRASLNNSGVPSRRPAACKRTRVSLTAWPHSIAVSQVPVAIDFPAVAINPDLEMPRERWAVGVGGGCGRWGWGGWGGWGVGGGVGGGGGEPKLLQQLLTAEGRGGRGRGTSWGRGVGGGGGGGSPGQRADTQTCQPGVGCPFIPCRRALLTAEGLRAGRGRRSTTQTGNQALGYSLRSLRL